MDGRILETPLEPESSPIRRKVCIGAYPVHECHGIVFAYLGPPDRKPGFPVYDTFEMPDTVYLSTGHHFPTNWFQLVENNFDMAHVVYLHTLMSPDAQFYDTWGVLPRIEYRHTPIGVRYTYTRRIEDHVWVGLEDIVLPNFTQAGAIFSMDGKRRKYFGRGSYSRWLVPLDDLNTRVYVLGHFNERSDPYREEYARQENLEVMEAGARFERSYEERQREPSDLEAAGSQGRVYLRRNEHLATTDKGVALFRRRLREAVRDLAAGREPAQPADTGAPPIPTCAGDTVLAGAPGGGRGRRGAGRRRRAGGDGAGRRRRSPARHGARPDGRGEPAGARARVTRHAVRSRSRDRQSSGIPWPGSRLVIPRSEKKVRQGVPALSAGRAEEVSGANLHHSRGTIPVIPLISGNPFFKFLARQRGQVLWPWTAPSEKIRSLRRIGVFTPEVPLSVGTSLRPATEAVAGVIVHHPHRLHERVADGGADELEAETLELPAQPVRERGRGRDLAMLRQRLTMGAPSTKRQKKGASPPWRSVTSSTAAALVRAARILRRLRTMPGSLARRSIFASSPGRDPDRIEAVVGTAVGLALAEDEPPAQARLRPFEQEHLEEVTVVVRCDAPLVVVVGGRTGGRPRPTRNAAFRSWCGALRSEGTRDGAPGHGSASRPPAMQAPVSNDHRRSARVSWAPEAGYRESGRRCPARRSARYGRSSDPPSILRPVELGDDLPGRAHPAVALDPDEGFPVARLGEGRARIVDHGHEEAAVAAVAHRGLHALVGEHAHHHHVLDAEVAQHVLEVGGS